MAAERKKIGVFFTFNKVWIGGLIYIINLIKCLKTLDDKIKPKIILFYNPANSSFLTEIKESNYPYIEFVEFKLKRGSIMTYAYSILLRKNLFIGNIINEYQLNGLFPLNDFPVKTKTENNCVLVSWFPDFQHKFYPQYFTKINLILRELRFQNVFKRTDRLVLSSQHVYEHFKEFSNAHKVPVHILKFVSVVHERKKYNINDLKKKYKIDYPYFMVSNQFYEHKNHLLVFKAIHKLREKHKEIRVVFTGRMQDYRNPEFIMTLNSFIADNNLTENCIFLEVLPRDEQLAIIKNSLCVIQPSKFEGWSTVIEDAKSLQVQVIASDFNVHKEQMEDKGYFFQQDSTEELSALMEGYLTGTIDVKPSFNNYNERMVNFAEKFIQVLNP